MRPTPLIAAGFAAAGLAFAVRPVAARHPDRLLPPGLSQVPSGSNLPRVHVVPSPRPRPGPDRLRFGRGLLLLLAVGAGLPLLRSRSRAGHGPMGPVPPRAVLAPADRRAFEVILHGVYAACDARDLDALGGMATPEMVERFAECFASDVYDIATGLRLRRMEPVRVWSEDGCERAEVGLRYSMTHLVYDGYGRVLHGACAGRVTVAQTWTYVRRGRWLLEAIRRGDGKRARGPRDMSSGGGSHAP